MSTRDRVARAIVEGAWEESSSLVVFWSNDHPGVKYNPPPPTSVRMCGAALDLLSGIEARLRPEYLGLRVISSGLTVQMSWDAVDAVEVDGYRITLGPSGARLDDPTYLLTAPGRWAPGGVA